jgi:hypothetical protein
MVGFHFRSANAQVDRMKFRFKNPLLSLDASVIDLCATMFDWAKFRLTKGAVKLHLLLDHDGYLPSYAVITEGKKHEVRVARQMPFAPGTILVFDRGYEDRTHLGLAKDTPAGRPTAIRSKGESKIQSFPRLGGLHHRYAVAP